MNELETRLREMLSDSVAGAEPRFTAADVRRRSRRRTCRLGAVGSVVAVLVVALAVVLTQFPALWRGSEHHLAGPSAVGRFTDRQFGWSIRFGSVLRAQPFHQQGQMASSDGVRVTNFTPDLSVPSQGIPAMGWLRDFPADGVAVQIWYTQADVLPAPPLHDSSFPLARSSFTQQRPYVGGSEPRPRYLGFSGDGIAFSAAVWTGPQASQAVIRAAWAVIGSLRFPPLRTGTVWQKTYNVLGEASSYPVGSVTPIAAVPRRRGGLGGSRYFLVHAPRAFYVVAGAIGPGGGQHNGTPSCELRYDAKARQFYCPGTRLRWNDLGDFIGVSSVNPEELDVGPKIATVAQDGHVLYCPYFGNLLATRLAGNPWS
jgi:hypothetical protein